MHSFRIAEYRGPVFISIPQQRLNAALTPILTQKNSDDGFVTNLGRRFKLGTCIGPETNKQTLRNSCSLLLKVLGWVRHVDTSTQIGLPVNMHRYSFSSLQ